MTLPGQLRWCPYLSRKDLALSAPAFVLAFSRLQILRPQPARPLPLLLSGDIPPELFLCSLPTSVMRWLRALNGFRVGEKEGMLNLWELISAVGLVSCNIYETLPQDNSGAK